MKRYEYKVYNIDYSIWTVSPTHLNPKKVKGTDLIFEREVE